MNPGLPFAGTPESSAPKAGAEDIVQLDQNHPGFRDPEYRFELPRPARPGPATRPAPLPGYPVPRAEAPKDWDRREFNGQPYYVIPLQ